MRYSLEETDRVANALHREKWWGHRLFWFMETRRGCCSECWVEADTALDVFTLGRRDDLDKAVSLLWEIARCDRQYSPRACYVIMRERLAERIDDFIGFDEMGQ